MTGARPSLRADMAESERVCSWLELASFAVILSRAFSTACLSAEYFRLAALYVKLSDTQKHNIWQNTSVIPTGIMCLMIPGAQTFPTDTLFTAQ